MFVVCAVDARPFAQATHALSFSKGHIPYAKPIVNCVVWGVEFKQVSTSALLWTFAHDSYAKREEPPKEKPACAGRDDSLDGAVQTHVNLRGTTRALARPHTLLRDDEVFPPRVNLPDLFPECKSSTKNRRSQLATPVIFNQKSRNIDFAINRSSPAQSHQSLAIKFSDIPRIHRAPSLPRLGRKLPRFIDQFANFQRLSSTSG
jgi:hypothetical protein